MIAGAIGGGLASILGLAGTGNGITIIPGTMLYIGNGQLPQYLLMVAVSFALGFALTYMFGYEDEAEVASETTTERLVDEAVTGTIVAPSEGVIPNTNRW